MTNRKYNDLLDQIYHDDNFYGRTLRYFLAKYWVAMTPFWDLINKFEETNKRKATSQDHVLTKDQEFEAATIRFVHEEVTKGLVQAYYDKRSVDMLKRWANNYSWKTSIYKEIPPYIVKFGNEWKNDFDDIVSGKLEHLFTEEMKQKICLEMYESENDA